MLRFLSVIRYECSRYNHAFTEKAQHLRRWISLRILTRGRLVPRQPRAIKSKTRTELHRYNIHYAKYIHRQTITTQMALTTNGMYIVWGLIGNNKPVDIKQENNMTQTTGWFDAFQAVKWRRLHDKMRHIAGWTNHYPAMGLRKIADEWFDSVLLA